MNEVENKLHAQRRVYAFLLILFVCVSSSLLAWLFGLLFQNGVKSHKLKELDITAEQCNLPLTNRLPLVRHPHELPDIWGLVEVVPVWEIRQIFDPAMTRACLRDQRVLLLGDSTMSELMHDLTLLLADVDPAAQLDYVNNATHNLSHNLTSKSTWPVDAHSSQTMTTSAVVHGTYRNMTVTSEPSNTLLRYRFTGHHDLALNRQGIATFFDAAFRDELDRLLALDPHLIVVNSGLHDRDMPGQFFENAVRLLADRLRTTGARVLWKGNVWIQNNSTRDQELAAYDAVARREFEARGMEFVNVSHVVRQMYCSAELQASDLITVDDDQHHYGAIMYFHNNDVTPIIGAHITQAVLNAMCST